LEVTVTADEDGFTVEDQFAVTVNPVNDAPDVFSLIFPDNDHEINRENYSVSCVWEEASDVDDEVLTYKLYLNIQHEELDSTLIFDDLENNNYTLENLGDLLTDLGIVIAEGDETVDEIIWWVEADDGELTTESDERRNLIVLVPTSVSGEKTVSPTEFSLSEPYPNPFNATTTLSYGLPKAANVSLRVFDLTGRLIAILVNGNQSAGFHSIVWNATDVQSSIYIVRIEADEFRSTRKLTLIR